MNGNFRSRKKQFVTNSKLKLEIIYIPAEKVVPTARGLSV